jgi:hypothetical protein
VSVGRVGFFFSRPTPLVLKGAINNDNQRLRKPRRQKVYLTAKFGRDNAFAQGVQDKLEKVRRTGIFTDIYGYSEFPDWILEDPTWKTHLEFLTNNNVTANGRGGGYWFWKPTLILHHLSKLNDGDLIVYSDLDLQMRFSYDTRLMETMIDWKADLSVYKYNGNDPRFNKGDAYRHICGTSSSSLTPTMDNGNHQHASGYLVLKKSTAALGFIQQWKELMTHYSLINDSPSEYPNHADFYEHRHDQSMLDLLLRCKHNSPNLREFQWKDNVNKTTIATMFPEGDVHWSHTFQVLTYRFPASSPKD